MLRVDRMIAVFFLARCAFGAELAVGPGKPFSRIEEALARTQGGDTVLVYPRADNRPYEKTVLYVTRPRITFRAAAPAGQRVRICGDGFNYSGSGSVPRAIFQFNKGADGCRVEGFELYSAHNDSENGAGIRINQANDVVIRNCHIHDNDMGIMSNSDGTQKTAVNQLVEGCLIHSNGNFKAPGYNHNLYVGGTSIKLVGCEIHTSLTGHNVKSRAHQTIVLGCYIHDSANREFDLVDGKDTAAPGSHAAIVGCIIAKDPRCRGNRGVIHFGQDGGNEHDGTLYLANNTIVTPFIGSIVTLSAPKARTQIINNIIWDGGTYQARQQLAEAAKGGDLKGRISGGSNWLSNGFNTPALGALGLERMAIAPRGVNPPFANPTRGDYRLGRSDPAIVDAGEPLPPEVLKLIGGMVLEYQVPLRSTRRSTNDEPDLGAYQASQ